MQCSPDVWLPSVTIQHCHSAIDNIPQAVPFIPVPISLHNWKLASPTPSSHFAHPLTPFPLATISLSSLEKESSFFLILCLECSLTFILFLHTSGCFLFRLQRSDCNSVKQRRYLRPLTIGKPELGEVSCRLNWFKSSRMLSRAQDFAELETCHL